MLEEESPAERRGDQENPGAFAVLGANRSRRLEAVFSEPAGLILAARALCSRGLNSFEIFSPFRIPEAERILGLPQSPVRFWTLFGVLAGIAGGLALAAGTAAVNDLTVGGKFTPTAIIPYFVIAFEGAILLGSLANLLGLIINARLYRGGTLPGYRPEFSRGTFGIVAVCSTEDDANAIQELLRPFSPKEVKIVSS